MRAGLPLTAHGTGALGRLVERLMNEAGPMGATAAEWNRRIRWSTDASGAARSRAGRAGA